VRFSAPAARAALSSPRAPLDGPQPGADTRMARSVAPAPVSHRLRTRRTRMAKPSLGRPRSAMPFDRGPARDDFARTASSGLVVAPSFGESRTADPHRSTRSRRREPSVAGAGVTTALESDVPSLADDRNDDCSHQSGVLAYTRNPGGTRPPRDGG